MPLLTYYMSAGLWQASKDRCAALQSTVSRSQSQASSLKATIQALFQVRLGQHDSLKHGCRIVCIVCSYLA